MPGVIGVICMFQPARFARLRSVAKGASANRARAIRAASFGELALVPAGVRCADDALVTVAATTTAATTEKLVVRCMGDAMAGSGGPHRRDHPDCTPAIPIFRLGRS